MHAEQALQKRRRMRKRRKGKKTPAHGNSYRTSSTVVIKTV
jgi:hypothetical protein